MELQNVKMSAAYKAEIESICKEFASAFEWPIEESGWLIVDPLSGYLNSLGYENSLSQVPACEAHPQVLIMRFKYGIQFIPGGAALKSIHSDAHNWMWL